jgi:hypothetical protein
MGLLSIMMGLLSIRRCLPTAALVLFVLFLAGCGSASTSNSGDGSDGSGGGTTVQGRDCAGGSTCGSLDVVQELVDDLVGRQIAGVLPEPLGSVVACTGDVVNNVLDVPDALLVGLEDLAATQDPASLETALEGVGNSLGNVVFNVQALLFGLLGDQTQVCDQAGSGEVIADGQGLTGTPLDAVLTPLAANLGELVDSLGGAAAGTPAAALVDPLVQGLDALLTVLEGGDVPSLPGLPGGGDNPLTALLGQLQSQLDGLSGGNGGDQNLQPLTDVLDTVVASLGTALGTGQTYLEDAAGSEVPVVSGLLGTLSVLLQDTGSLVNEIGEYDGVNANFAIETLLENTLGNLLTEVIPLSFIGEQTGQDLATPIRAGISQVISTLGDGTALVIEPLLDIVLDDAASPLLDPIENVLAQLLGAAPIELGDVLAGGISQLTDALGAVLGQASGGGLGGGNPLDLLLGGLQGGGAGPTGTPADLLLGALIDNDPTGLLSGLLGGVVGGLLDLLGGLLP